MCKASPESQVLAPQLLLLLLACLLVCAFKVVLSLSLFWFLSFSLFVFLCLFLEKSAVFISMWVGVGWSYNHLLVRKLTFIILELYTNLKCDRIFQENNCTWLYAFSRICYILHYKGSFITTL